MSKLIIQPEERYLDRYVNLAQRNNFDLEVDAKLIQKDKKSLNNLPIKGVHGSNLYTAEAMCREIESLVNNGNQIEYIVYHDDVMSRISKNEISKVSRIVSEYGIKIFIENEHYKTPFDFWNFVSNISKNFNEKNIGVCLDLGHILLSQNLNPNEWAVGTVDLFHISNNDGKFDQHNSLYRGRLDYTSVNRLLSSGGLVSLEVDKRFSTYVKNIEFMIQNEIFPFRNRNSYINLPIFQKKVFREIKFQIEKYLGEEVDYAFVYGSVANGSATFDSDIDCFISLKKEDGPLVRSFISSHMRLCEKFGFSVDVDYPVETFLSKKITDILDGEKTIAKLTNDEREIVKAHCMRNYLIYGSHSKYKKNTHSMKKLYDNRPD